MAPWIAVDLDGTLARYDGWKGHREIGEPVPAMIARVKAWLAEGKEVRIFTARVCRGLALEIDSDLAEQREYIETMQAIESWCQEHIGAVLPVTCVKDFGMVELWDDRAVQVVPNMGARADGKED